MARISISPLSIGENKNTTGVPESMKSVVAVCFTLALVVSAGARADVAAGQSTYAAKGCLGCHGSGGVSVVATYPSLRGQTGDYIRKSLTEFRSGVRKNPVMNAMAAGLSDADIENLADYIGSLN